jgi:hypothetical protein
MGVVRLIHVLIAIESGESDQDCTVIAGDFMRYGIRRKSSKLAAAKLAAPCFGIVRPKGNGKISPIKKASGLSLRRHLPFKELLDNYGDR